MSCGLPPPSPALDNWTRNQAILFLYSLELKRWRKANRNWAVTFAPLSTTKSFSNFLACKNIPINLLCILLGRSVWNWVDFRGGSPWGALLSCPIAQWKVQPSRQVTWAWVHGRKSQRCSLHPQCSAASFTRSLRLSFLWVGGYSSLSGPKPGC